MKNIKTYLPVIFILIFSFILSLCIYKDYGVSWDEEWQREMGQVSYDYIFHNDQRLNTYIERDHGVGFELPLIMIEKVLKLTDSRDIYLMRHLVQNLFYLVCMFVGYLLIYRTFKSQLLACIGLVILIFTPRLFAHSFFNSKDIPFMGMFLVSLAAGRWAFMKDKYWAYLVLGAVLGYTTSIRLLSVLLVGFWVGFFVIDIIHEYVKRGAPLKKAASLLFFIAGFSLVIYVCWPMLWYRPLYNFIQAFNSFSKFRWEGGVLFNGEIISGSALPWTYIPVMFGITVPVLWLLLGFTGIVLLLISFVKQPMRYLLNLPERNLLLYFLSFITPVLMIIILDSVVYDDWRHVYFIYPSFVMLLMYGLHALLKTKAAAIIKTLVAVQFIAIVVFMIKYHPHQQVYFNELVSKGDEELRRNYELEYWGCSNKQALEYILAHDTSAVIVVSDGITERNNIRILPPAERKRVRQNTEGEQPEYYLCLFRTYGCRPGGKRIYDIKVLNSTIMTVYKYGQ